MHHADLDQLHGAQLALILRRPGFVLHPETETHAAQIAAGCQCQHITAELGVRHVQAEAQAPAILGQSQRAGAGARQQPAGVVVDQAEHIAARVQGGTERAGPDGLGKRADRRSRAERRGIALKPAPVGAQLGRVAQLEAIGKAGRDHAPSGGDDVGHRGE